ncbi:hypothetical protein MishRS11D_44250 (plasmid) [Methylomagnum ishizawai]|nr:hypothetical protein MishRS11D_44250 [Methylomagnum ishizawai]
MVRHLRHLRDLGHRVNRKRVQRLMRTLGLAGMAPGPGPGPGPDTSRPHPRHKVYPYLLRGMEIGRPNQVWSADITYVRLPGGFVYLVAVIDWYSRKVLAWRVSNTLDGGFCVDCLEQALGAYGTPEIFNSDQGCQFRSCLAKIQTHFARVVLSMAMRMTFSAVPVRVSKSLLKRRNEPNQANVRSTIQRFGRAAKPSTIRSEMCSTKPSFSLTNRTAVPR